VSAVEAQDARASGAGPQKPEQRQDQRGLASPVGPQQADGLSFAGNAETAGDPVEDLPPSQPDFQVLEFDDRCGWQCQRGTLLRLSSSIMSMIKPEIRVRLAAWICSGVPSNTTRIGSRPAAASSRSAGLGVSPEMIPSAPFAFTQPKADGSSPADE